MYRLRACVLLYSLLCGGHHRDLHSSPTRRSSDLGGAPYRIAGTNMWYAAYLGADAPIGNRGRLKRELDRVAALGINNVRILGSSEFSPLKNSVRPTFRNRTRHFNETLLRGLDNALAEM